MLWSSFLSLTITLLCNSQFLITSLQKIKNLHLSVFYKPISVTKNIETGSIWWLWIRKLSLPWERSYYWTLWGTTRTFIIPFTYNLSVIISVTNDPLHWIFIYLFTNTRNQLDSQENQVPFLDNKKKGSYSVLGGVSYWLRNCDLLDFNLNVTLLKHQSLWSYCLWNKTLCLKRKIKFSWICHNLSLCVFFSDEIWSALLFGTKCLVYRSQELN